MKMTASLSKDVGVKRACHALTVSRAGFYRWRNLSENEKPASVRTLPPLALSREEQQRVLDALHEERFVDKAPQEVYASLLDEGTYLCSVRTMYRILEAHQEVKERRNQLRHPIYAKPELLAQGPNQVWSRDITKLKGPAMDLLLPVRHPRYLQPIRCRLDGCLPGIRIIGKKVDRTNLRKTDDPGR